MGESRSRNPPRHAGTLGLGLTRSGFPTTCIIHVVPKRISSGLDHCLDILGEIKGVATLIEQSTDRKQICRYIRRLNVLKAELAGVRVSRRADSEFSTPAQHADHIVAE